MWLSCALSLLLTFGCPDGPALRREPHSGTAFASDSSLWFGTSNTKCRAAHPRCRTLRGCSRTMPVRSGYHDVLVGGRRDDHTSWDSLWQGQSQRRALSGSASHTRCAELGIFSCVLTLRLCVQRIPGSNQCTAAAHDEGIAVEFTLCSRFLHMRHAYMRAASRQGYCCAGRHSRTDQQRGPWSCNDQPHL